MIPADALDGFSHSNGQVWKSMDTNSLTVAGVYLAVEPTEFASPSPICVETKPWNRRRLRRQK